MRPVFACAPAAALVLLAVACSEDKVEGVNVGGDAADDGTITDDDGGSVDGNVTPNDSTKPSKVTSTDETLPLGGAMRQYTLVVPKTYAASRKYPLVLGLHGDGQNGPSFRQHLRLDEIAGDDAIVAYPTASPEWDLGTPYDQNPDQQLIAAVIDAVKAKRSIDATKVWVIGYSKGGFVANAIACRKPGTFTAMANHASGAPEEPRGSDGFPICAGVIGLPTMATEGQNDKGIGGLYAANYWAKVNGCSTSRSDTAPAPCQKYDGCPGDKPVVYCETPGTNHYPIWTNAAAASWTFLTGL